MIPHEFESKSSLLYYVIISDLLRGLLLNLLVVGTEHRVDRVHLEDPVLDHERGLLEELVGDCRGGRGTVAAGISDRVAHVIFVLEPQQLDEGLPVE